MSYREDDSRREPEWMTLGQAAKFLGVAQSTIRKWSDNGRIPTFYTPGGHRRYRRGDLEAFIDRWPATSIAEVLMSFAAIEPKRKAA